MSVVKQCIDGVVRSSKLNIEFPKCLFYVFILFYFQSMKRTVLSKKKGEEEGGKETISEQQYCGLGKGGGGGRGKEGRFPQKHFFCGVVWSRGGARGGEIKKCWFLKWEKAGELCGCEGKLGGVSYPLLCLRDCLGRMVGLPPPHLV